MQESVRHAKQLQQELEAHAHIAQSGFISGTPGVTEEEMEQRYDNFDDTLPALPTNHDNEVTLFANMTDEDMLASPTPSLQPPPPPAAAAASTPSQRPTGTLARTAKETRTRHGI
jgi:hypothetical protein